MTGSFSNCRKSAITESRGPQKVADRSFECGAPQSVFEKILEPAVRFHEVLLEAVDDVARGLDTLDEPNALGRLRV